MTNNQNASGSIGFGGLLCILFIALKLTHVITWSWWWVLSPLLIPLGIAGIFLLIIGVLYIIAKRS